MLGDSEAGPGGFVVAFGQPRCSPFPRSTMHVWSLEEWAAGSGTAIVICACAALDSLSRDESTKAKRRGETAASGFGWNAWKLGVRSKTTNNTPLHQGGGMRVFSRFYNGQLAARPYNLG